MTGDPGGNEVASVRVALGTVIASETMQLTAHAFRAWG